MRSRNPKRKRRNGLAAFRAIEAEVAAALNAGFTLVAIYEEHESQLEMSYEQFTRHARPLRKAAQAKATVARLAARSPAARGPPAGTPAATRRGPPVGRPEDAVPKLDMDDFATRALNNKDLI